MFEEAFETKLLALEIHMEGFARCLRKRRGEDITQRYARISDDELYRWLLIRTWDWELQTLIVVMLNPSTADGKVDDPTIKTLVRFATRHGFGRIVVMNLFAWRATKPEKLFETNDPVGFENRETHKVFLSAAANYNWPVYVGWGAHKMAELEGAKFEALADEYGVDLLCFGRTAAGYPRHPLYIKNDVVPELYHRARL